MLILKGAQGAEPALCVPAANSLLPPLLTDYYAVVTVPAGARSIQLQELHVSPSYLAVRSLASRYYLTGDWTIDWPGKFPFAGTVFDYQRSFNQPESLYAAGPTNETLVFEVSLASVCSCPDVHYRIGDDSFSSALGLSERLKNCVES